MGISDCHGQGDAASVHGFWSVVVRDEGGVIQVGMDV